jgi:signal transduction histidine kinase
MHFLLWILNWSFKHNLKNHKLIRRHSSFTPNSLNQIQWEQSLLCLFHEIRNYSCTLRGNTTLLRMEPLSESMLGPLGRLERTTEKIDSLLKELLEASSITDVSALCPLEIVDLIQGCIDDHFSESETSIKIQSESEIPIISGDFQKLERVFLNLFRNAREAGSKSIKVKLSVLPHRLRILVEDDGEGATSEQIGRMFQPLYTTKKDKGGTGLGLYMVKAIIESHRGSIRVVSKNSWGGKGSGMIFCLELPRKQKSMADFFAKSTGRNASEIRDLMLPKADYTG